MSMFKKTKADEVAKKVIDKVVGPILLVGLIGWGVVSCTTPDEPKTPEEIRAEQVSRYLDRCEWWGTMNEAYEMGGARKYKDYSYITYLEVNKMQTEDPTLDSEQCTAAFERGEQEGRRLFLNGRIDR